MFIQTLCFFLRDVPLIFCVGRLERLPGGRYGVCVSECAQEGQVVEDYGHARQTSWLVLQPFFPVFQRCLPFQKPTVKASTKLCVKPACGLVLAMGFHSYSYGYFTIR
jgi:hypothetical protein